MPTLLHTCLGLRRIAARACRHEAASRMAWGPEWGFLMLKRLRCTACRIDGTKSTCVAPAGMSHKHIRATSWASPVPTLTRSFVAITLQQKRVYTHTLSRGPVRPLSVLTANPGEEASSTVISPRGPRTASKSMPYRQMSLRSIIAKTMPCTHPQSPPPPLLRTNPQAGSSAVVDA